jgi:hypothetical protein
MFITTTDLTTSTNLVEVLPVPFTIVDSDFLTRINAFGNEDYLLQAKPSKALVLRIWQAGVVDEAGEVALRP